MHIVITGADGFVGAALAQRLLSNVVLAGAAMSKLTLIDRHFSSQFNDRRVSVLSGDFGQESVLDSMSDTAVDILFHLASVPGAQAERDFRFGYDVNLLATLALFKRVARQQGDRVARVVFASSIAVYGSTLPAVIDHATPARPAMSYGAHKLAAEIVLADLSRRGTVDGLSLRLPGIVARPGVSTGHGSAFMSAVMHAAAAGSPYICPVSADATSWWMSLPCCVDNLLHAVQIDTSGLPDERAYALPVLRLTLRQVLEALGRRFGKANMSHIEHVPDETIEHLFGRQPPLHLPQVEALGFRNDGNADQLVLNALRALP